MWHVPWRGLPPVDAVHMAAGSEHGLTLLLTGCGPEFVDEADAEGWTALHRSAAEGDAQRVRRLLRCSADAAAPTASGETALALAMAGGHTACIRELALAAAGNRTSRSGLNAMQVAVSSGKAAAVRALIGAVEQDGEAVVAALVLSPVRTAPGAASNRPLSPVCLAIEGGHSDILSELLQAAPLAAERVLPDGSFPLHLATAAGQTACVRLLLQAAPWQAGMRSTWRDFNFNGLPIHLAAWKGWFVGRQLGLVAGRWHALPAVLLRHRAMQWCTAAACVRACQLTASPALAC